MNQMIILAFLTSCVARGPRPTTLGKAVSGRDVFEWAPLMRYGPAPTAVPGVDQVIWEMAIPEQMAIDLVGAEAVSTCQAHIDTDRYETCESVIRPCTRLAISKSGLWIWHWVGKCGPADPSSWRIGGPSPDGKGSTTYYSIPPERVPILANDVDGAWVYQ